MNDDLNLKHEINSALGDAAGQNVLPHLNEKSKLIYEAAISLLEEDSTPGDIKMSEIARRAGIGKSTLYEYFDSKEQLIHNAKIYAIDRLTDELTECIEKAGDFRQKIKAFILRLSGQAAERHILFHSVAKYDIPEMLANRFVCTADRKRIILKWLKIADSICQSAMEQGIIKEMPCDYKKHIAIITLITTSLIYCKNINQYGDTSQEDMIGIVTGNLEKML